MLNYDAPRHPVPTALYRVELVKIEKKYAGIWQQDFLADSDHPT